MSGSHAQNSHKSIDEKEISTKTYVFANDTIIQRLKMIFGGGNQAIFTISVQNTKRNLHSLLHDTAYRRNNPQADNIHAYEDEKENDMYGATEFVYNKKCYLTFGVEVKTRARVFITEATNCKKLYIENCPWGSIGTLRLVK